MGEVRLVDLEIIKRYSLAVRQESAPAEDVLAAIDASREAVAAAIAENAASENGSLPAPTRKAARKRATPTKKGAATRKATR
jgi:4-aminobutyrate aminotransferase-like enzyme